MKFSRSLGFARTGEWKEVYLNYSYLKKSVNQIGAYVAMEKVKSGSANELKNLEDNFAKLFAEELAKVSKFYNEQIYDKQEKNLLDENEFVPTRTASLNEKTLITSFEPKAMELAYFKLCDLKEFLQINHTGFLKILRSHDKYSKTLVQAKMQALVEVSLPQTDLDLIQAHIDTVVRKYSEAFYNGNCENGKNKLNILMQERLTQLRATAWQEAIERDRQVTVSIGDVDEPSPEKSRASVKPHHGSSPYKLLQILGLVSVFGLLLIFPVLSERSMNSCMAMCILAIGLWITEAIPLFVTALAVPVLIVTLQILKDATGAPLTAKGTSLLVASKMFSTVTLMLIGGFSIAAATTKYGVARQMALVLLKLAGQSNGLLIAYVMVLSQVVSAFISNVTAPVLCFTLLSPLLRAIPPENPLGKQLVLAVAVASNLGGAISPISSPQNVFAIDKIGNIGWPQWLAIGVPFCVVASVGSWAVIVGKYRTSKKFNSASYFNGSNFTWGVKEITVVATIAITIILWAFPVIGVDIFGDNGMIALLPVIVFFGSGMLGKDDFNSFPWNVVMLAIGGSLMGEAVRSSGLLGMIADSLRIFSSSGPFSQLILTSFVITIATCFISHTVGAMIFIPIVKAISNDSRMVVMGATLACSAGMALPISSFPNMAASAQEDSMGRPFLSSREFVYCGIICSLITWIAIASVGYSMMSILRL